LFRRKGFSGISMQDVSDAEGSLYSCIRSKEDLLFEILKCLHKEGEEIISAVQFGPDDPLGQLRIYIEKPAISSGLNTERLVIFLCEFENIADEKRNQIISHRGRRRGHRRHPGQRPDIRQQLCRAPEDELISGPVPGISRQAARLQLLPARFGRPRP
jgi:AcrR family transcriptional regulator